MDAHINDYILAQAKGRLVNAAGLRAMAAHKQGQAQEVVLGFLFEELRAAEQYAVEVVKGLEAVPFIEAYLQGEVTNTACNVPPEMVESSMKMREGFAAVLRQLTDRRAMVHYGADTIHAEVVAQFFPHADEFKAK